MLQTLLVRESNSTIAFVTDKITDREARVQIQSSLPQPFRCGGDFWVRFTRNSRILIFIYIPTLINRELRVIHSSYTKNLLASCNPCLSISSLVEVNQAILA